jgi:hypothetical protein
MRFSALEICSEPDLRLSFAFCGLREFRFLKSAEPDLFSFHRFRRADMLVGLGERRPKAEFEATRNLTDLAELQ